jgi:hypothetical protein
VGPVWGVARPPLLPRSHIPCRTPPSPCPKLSPLARFDSGNKGYLDKAEVARLLSEVGSGGGAPLHPRVGPFASGFAGTFPYAGGLGGGYQAGLGSSIYGGAPGRSNFGPGSSLGRPGGGPGSGYTLPPVSSSGALLPPQPPQPGPEASAIALAQAYQTRLAALSTVAASLLSKRESIAVQLARVQGRAAEVASVREAVEAETLADTEAILHRLRAVESTKQAIMQRDADVLVGDITSIDRFYAALTSYQPTQSSFPGAAGGDAGGGGSALYDPALALEFMRAYPELCAEADRLTGKPIKTDLDARSDDFERETASRIDLASKYQALVDLVAAKDRIILQMLKVSSSARGSCARVRGLSHVHSHIPVFHVLTPPPDSQERESVMRERETARAAVVKAGAEKDEAVRDKENDVTHWTR